MDFLSALILGLVEGVTEFIPVSSTGHLIVVGDWLHFTGERAKVFEIFIQLGAILAVVWLYRSTIRRVALDWKGDPASRRLIVNLMIAFLPAAIVGFLAHHWITEHLFNPRTVAGALVAGGFGILLIEGSKPATTLAEVEGMPASKALGIGLAQVLSLFPGVSRSGATIMGGYLLGLSRTAATEFSFFLAIPVMFAATLFELVQSRALLSVADLPVFALGFVTAFVSALLVVKVFLGYVSRSSFAVFAWYRIGFGAALFALYWKVA